jgi:hypothetical protein
LDDPSYVELQAGHRRIEDGGGRQSVKRADAERLSANPRGDRPAGNGNLFRDLGYAFALGLHRTNDGDRSSLTLRVGVNCSRMFLADASRFVSITTTRGINAGRPSVEFFELAHLGSSGTCNILLQKMHTVAARPRGDPRTDK